MRKPLILATFALVSISGCSGGSSGGGTPPPPVIAVAISSAPTTVALGATASVTATVTNDSAAKGVTWSCTPAGACGSFNPTSTASGAATTYTAPMTEGMVTIIATSVADGTKTKSTSVTITGPAITMSFTTLPPAALQAGGTASIAATAANDPATTPVNWSCTPTGACGSFSLTSTANGAATVYTAPAAAPTGGSVTITATSATDPSKTVTAAVVITNAASLGMLKGQYAFFIQAPTGDRGTTTFVGSVNLDGNGNVLGGVEDVVSTVRFDLADPVLPTVAGAQPNTSYYTVDPSGHGTLRMDTQMGETLDLSFVLTSASHGQIIEVGGDPGSGTIDLQQPTTAGFTTSQITGTYSFTMDGIDSAVPPTSKLAFGGAFTADGTSTISSATLDMNTNGTVTSNASLTGNFTAPDTNGRGMIGLLGQGFSLHFLYYIVTPKVLRVFEEDNIYLMGGSAYLQGTGTTTLAGNYVYRHAGWSGTGLSARTVAAGQFAAPAGAITGGISDANSGGAPPVATTGTAVSGAFTSGLTDAAGSSTFNLYPVDPTVNILDPNSSTGTGGILLLHTDAKILGTGVIIPQSATTAAFTGGGYALNLTNSIAVATPNELDLVGAMTSDGTANFVNGLADYAQNGSIDPTAMTGATLTGTFAKDTTNAGHFSGTFTVTPPTVSGSYFFNLGGATPTFNVSIYQVSGSQAFVIETDTQASSQGLLTQQQIP
jgi:hypothetical protein